MRDLSNLLLEKLKINKNTKLHNNYMFIMFYDAKNESGVDYTICVSYDEAKIFRDQKKYLCGYYCPQNLLHELTKKMTSNLNSVEEYKELDEWIKDNNIYDFDILNSKEL